jgi:hypothetical protein
MTGMMKRLLQMTPIVLAMLIVFSDAQPARAASCFQDLRDCYGRASRADGFWQMWAMGLDCELTLTDCTRRALIGR